MMELLTAFVAESTNSLLKAAIGRIVQEIELARGFKADLRDLERQLRRLDAILCGARSGAGNNRDLNEWMKEIRKVAHRAEDVMDEYSYELLKRKIALRNRPQRLRRFKTKTRFFFSLSSNPVAFRFKMAHRVKSIKESINTIYDEAKQHGISPVEVAGGKSYVYDSSDHDHDVAAMSLQRQMPHNDVLIQRKDAEDDVVRWLREASGSDRHLSVVGIWGMAGLGKTTLCESIFKTMEIHGEFEERIWICVSHDFEFIHLLNRVIEKIEGHQHPSNTLDLHALEAKLVDIMKGRKFLLVLDDIWDTFEKYWDTLRRCLKDVGASRGNAILATSRLKGTLEKSDAFRILSLEKLSDEDSRTLFKHCVGENNLSGPTKANLGWKMLSKCDGVPLAIKALGGVLKSQNSTSQWTKIEQDHNIWNKVDHILPSVKLSFKYLPSALLKQCFAFCAIFKEDEVIEKGRLIQLWMAQGFLQPYDHEKEQLCDELLGEKFLDILLNYSLFQEATFDDLGNVQDCKMHDVVRSLALDISKGDTEIIECRSLHLQEVRLSKLSNGSSASFDISRKEEFIKKAKHLRALSLVSVGLEELPDWIGELKHLRYLDISRNRIRSLPVGLGKLYYLQTLIIAYNFHWCLPAAMFPKEFTNLNNLLHLCSDLYMEIPVGLGMLTSLQTLPAIDLDEHSCGGTASELGNLHNLKGRLRLRGFRDAGIIEELKKVKLGTKKNIEELDLRFDSHVHQNQEDVNHVMMLEALEPHPNLLALQIFGYQSKVLPNWMMEMTGYGGHGLDNLVSLTLANCYVLEQLPSMKNLSALKVLRISFCHKAKSLQNLKCLTSLQSLRLFACLEMQNLSDIRFLSCLEVLSIEECRKMTCLPTGLSYLPNLKTLRIRDLSPDVSIFPFPNLNHLSPLSTSLRGLHIRAFRMDKVVNLPSQIQHLCQLRYLEIGDFKSLKELPEWLGNLTSLETLVLMFLPHVECLPSQATMEGLSQLMTLSIHHCSRLQQACSPDGSEWIKIQHIRHVKTS